MWYRLLVESEYRRLGSDVDRGSISWVVSCGLVDYLFREESDRPYHGIKSRLDRWSQAHLDSKGREFVPRVPAGQKSSTRYNVPAKAPHPGDPGKTEVAYLADFEEDGVTYTFDLHTGEIFDVR